VGNPMGMAISLIKGNGNGNNAAGMGIACFNMWQKKFKTQNEYGAG